MVLLERWSDDIDINYSYTMLFFALTQCVCLHVCVTERERKCNIACLLRYYVAVTTQKISHGVYCRVVNPVTIIDLVKWLIMALSLVLFMLNVDAFF